jgi:hypothetical protein
VDEGFYTGGENKDEFVNLHLEHWRGIDYYAEAEVAFDISQSIHVLEWMAKIYESFETLWRVVTDHQNSFEALTTRPRDHQTLPKKHLYAFSRMKS